MSLSSVNVMHFSQITYDSQGVLLSTSGGHVFISKQGISSITNNTSSIVINFCNNPINFTVSASENYLITTIYDTLTNSHEGPYDSGEDSD